MVIEEAVEAQRPHRLIALMQARNVQGRAKYGVPLSTHDGRDTAVDALQEVLDLIVHLRKCKSEGRYVADRWQMYAFDIAEGLLDEIEEESPR